MKSQFTQREVNKIFEQVPSRTILSWTSQGLIVPQDHFEDGRGIHRLYSREDVYQIGILEVMFKSRLHVVDIQRAWHNIKDQEVISVMITPDSILTINYAAIKARIDKKIHAAIWNL